MTCIFIVFFLIIIFLYIFCKLTCGMCRSSSYLMGKTALITGGNSGIGLEIALNLASRGCKVIIAGRHNMEKSRLEILRQTNNPQIYSKHLNLASFKSIRKFASEINSEIDKLDILVNNAGVPTSHDITEDNLDLTMQVNYFGPFLLTHLLLDKLRKSENGRIVFTSSSWAFFDYININTFGRFNKNEDIRGYAISKLATIMATDLFAKKLKNTRITVNSVHPGLVATNIFTRIPNSFVNSPIRVFMTKLSGLLGKDAYEGSQSSVHVAISEENSTVTGKYYWDCHPFIKPWQAYNEDLCRKVWEISEDRVQLTAEEKLS